MIKKPFEIIDNTFSDVYNSATLYVPCGTKAKYEATRGWNQFTKIVEMEAGQELEPIENGENLDFGDSDSAIDEV